MTAVVTRTSVRPGEPQVGTPLPVVKLPITYSMVVALVDGTRDYFPGHHDPEYARAQGQPDIYLNTGFYQGFVDRITLDWAGPAWFVHRRTMRIVQSAYPGDVLTGTGKIET